MHGVPSVEDLDPWLALITAVVGAGAALAGAITGRVARRAAQGKVDDSPLADRIQRLSSTAVLAKVLADEITAEIAVIEQRAGRLAEEAEQAEILAGLNEKHRQAMAQALRTELHDSQRQGRWAAFWSSALWFVAGVAASILVTLFVHPF
ncbi:hypothetical protein ACTJKO_07670 [Curtobacterium sp. 22159]|uniref:hypothetical protein n=1 Tax=Curtobacterium sp. 22159 TaxID=3453882 RepID=UPI003F83A163